MADKLIASVTPVKKDHFNLVVKEINLGTFEISELRHLIQIIDNNI